MISVFYWPYLVFKNKRQTRSSHMTFKKNAGGDDDADNVFKVIC